MLPLVPGMQVMLQENFATAYGFVNGSIGLLHSVEYELDDLDRRVAKCAYVEFENCSLAFPDFPDGTVPILPTGKSLTYKRFLANIACGSGYYAFHVHLVSSAVTSGRFKEI